LQQYEAGAKKINNASFKTVVALARALGCDVEDLYEYDEV
jgi:DNA-binding Xre family transcriptional regulator